ncbi:MAG: GNAT family N-acetyltransferase, partial [Lachnospiraceae bacterium]|nr:GNAT family N-acetyltransferase [Lachnospiraceae bacterium]
CQADIIPVQRMRVQAAQARGCYQAYYTRGVPLPVRKDLVIRRLDESYAEEIFAEYHERVTLKELREHLARGDLYGAFVKKEAAGKEPSEEATGKETGEEAAGKEPGGEATESESSGDIAFDRKNPKCELAGFIGTHSEGALGMLQVRPRFRRRGIAAALEAYMINETLKRGEIPFGHIFEGNEASLHLQRKLGLNVTDVCLWWVR